MILLKCHTRWLLNDIWCFFSDRVKLAADLYLRTLHLEVHQVHQVYHGHLVLPSQAMVCIMYCVYCCTHTPTHTHTHTHTHACTHSDKEQVRYHILYPGMTELLLFCRSKSNIVNIYLGEKS